MASPDNPGAAAMKDLVQTVGRRGPIILSLLAIALLGFVYVTGFERGLHDEGAAAHTWQLLIGLQIPLIAVFVATADWSRPAAVFKVLALQVLLLIGAMLPVALMHL
jgi:hypothetical protein